MKRHTTSAKLQKIAEAKKAAAVAEASGRPTGAPGMTPGMAPAAVPADNIIEMTNAL